MTDGCIIDRQSRVPHRTYHHRCKNRRSPSQ
nr:MAG TPA: hypothetical protein [Bacteriophage sp.]DAG35473.1 MAG TPA: hypothetical protein [Bacteriophage sp.]